MDENPTYGIVFSGGGALAAWEVGCYEAIRGRHRGAPPVIVTGASAGAINAAGICAEMPGPQLQKLWSGIRRRDVYRFRISIWDALSVGFHVRRFGLLDGSVRFLSKYRSLHDTSALENTLRENLSGYFNSFAQSPIHFAASLTNLNNSKREYFYKVPPGATLPEQAKKNDVLWTRVDGLELLLNALMGSTALPVLFPPKGPYFDGGVLLNQPITPLILLKEPDVLYVVIPTAKALGRTDNVIEIGQTVLTTWISASLVSQMDKLRIINKLRRDRTDEGEPDKRLPVCVIRPTEDLTAKFGVGLLSFGYKVSELVADGKAAADEKLNRFSPAEPSETTWYDT